MRLAGSHGHGPAAVAWVAALALAAALLSGGCCGRRDRADPGPADPAPADEPAPAAEVTLLFASSFDSGGPCHRGEHDGCDLYRAQLDLDGPVARDVERLTDVPGQAEWFPTIDASGELALYEARAGQRGHVEVLSLDGTYAAEIAPGRYPDFDHQGQRFAYSTGGRRLKVVPYERDEHGLVPSQASGAGRGRDPQFHPDGGQLIFHVQPDGETTRTALADLAGRERTDFSEPDRCAHAAFAPSGEIGVCSVRGTVYGRRLAGGAWGALEPLATPPGTGALPDRFAGCEHLGYGYPEFCGDDEHLVATLACARGGALQFANLVLVDLATGEVTDLHWLLAAAHGAEGGESATAACSLR